MTASKNRFFNKTVASVGLLFFWILIQANITAHELLEEHTFETPCEWQCQIKYYDDLIPVQPVSNLVELTYIDIRINYQSPVIPSTQQQRPYLRGPPQ